MKSSRTTSLVVGATALGLIGLVLPPILGELEARRDERAALDALLAADDPASAAAEVGRIGTPRILKELLEVIEQRWAQFKEEFPDLIGLDLGYWETRARKVETIESSALVEIVNRHPASSVQVLGRIVLDPSASIGLRHRALKAVIDNVPSPKLALPVLRKAASEFLSEVITAVPKYGTDGVRLLGELLHADSAETRLEVAERLRRFLVRSRPNGFATPSLDVAQLAIVEGEIIPALREWHRHSDERFRFAIELLEHANAEAAR